MISGWWLLPPVLAWGIHAAIQRRQMIRLTDELRLLRSEHQALVRRFQKRSDRLDALFGTVNEAILRLDMQGNVIALNDRARRVFQLPGNFPLPQPVAALYRHPGWNKAIRKALQQLPEPYDLPDIILQNYTFAVRLALLGNEQALLLCLDVSKQRELEGQHEQLLRDLMHDLKTPLTSILGYARSIEKFGNDEAIREEAVGTIVQEARRLNRLLESLLVFDQMEGSTPAPDSHCDPAQVMHEILVLMKPAAEAAGARLETRVEKKIRSFPMESGDLHRLLTNLVDNAIRYSPADGKVCLFMDRLDDQIELCITDEGPGIAPRHLPHVTERFYRAEDSRSAGGGHGVGLAIVAETVARYGGQLTLANRREGGLEARIRMPVGEATL